ncbi:hypothetical protein PR048_029913 [Dryococelus australis]|uniref:Uncharacterized protein n=1 Tax=Dryococelus australis TaxID=614101 RepID=A0ABQ9G8D2_9NEOP|nr:hypothetical protein PR048_029913 [Dryococelus australis]
MPAESMAFPKLLRRHLSCESLMNSITPSLLQSPVEYSCPLPTQFYYQYSHRKSDWNSTTRLRRNTVTGEMYQHDMLASVDVNRPPPFMGMRELSRFIGIS